MARVSWKTAALAEAGAAPTPCELALATLALRLQEALEELQVADAGNQSLASAAETGAAAAPSLGASCAMGRMAP